MRRAGKRRAGFTLTELMTASALGVGVVSLALTLSISSLMGAMDGSIHLSVVGKARATEQQIVRIVQHARAVGAQSNRLSIVMTDLTESEIRFIDGDSNPNTLADNRLQYDPDLLTAGDESILCDHVSPISGEQMFQVVNTSPRSAALSFHVGERVPPGRPDTLPGDGYQGIEVRLSATPRNGMGTYN